MAIYRLSHRVLGMKRDNLGLGLGQAISGGSAAVSVGSLNLGMPISQLRRHLLSGVGMVALSAAWLPAGVAGAWAEPLGATVVNGQASITSANGVTTIVNTPNAIINWKSFSIGSNEAARFVQQSTTSAVLNRVTVGHTGAIVVQRPGVPD